MVKLNLAVCEDNDNDRKLLISLLKKSGMLYSLDTFESGEELLACFQAKKYDLIFMDIYMDGSSGVETIRKIRELDGKVFVAFTTTSTDYALDSYRLNALKYMEKPVGGKEVLELLELVLAKKLAAPHVTLQIKGKQVSLPLSNTLYMEQKAHSLILYLTGGDIIQTTDKLNHVQTQFIEQPFFRCHKSYLVNLAYVKHIDRDLYLFVMKEGANVYIRRESMKEARQAWENYIFQTTRGI